MISNWVCSSTPFAPSKGGYAFLGSGFGIRHIKLPELRLKYPPLEGVRGWNLPIAIKIPISLKGNLNTPFFNSIFHNSKPPITTFL